MPNPEQGSTIKTILRVTGAAVILTGGAAIAQKIFGRESQSPQPPITQTAETPTSLSPIAVATHAPEATPTPKPIELPGIEISENSLAALYQQIRGNSTFQMEADVEKRPVTEDLEKSLSYASSVWNESITDADLQNPIKLLKKKIADWAMGGIQNSTYYNHSGNPQEGAIMRTYRSGKLKVGSNSGEAEFTGSMPAKVIGRNDTRISLIGVSGNEAVLAIEEGFKRGEKEITPRQTPRLHLAIMPYRAKDAKAGEKSVEGLLKESGYNITVDGRISFQLVEGGQEYQLTPNTFEATMLNKIKGVTGTYWVDKLPDGTLHPEPVVPFIPREFFEGNKDNIEYEVAEDDKGNIFAKNQKTGEIFATASFNGQEWEWGSAVEPTPTATVESTKEPTVTPTKVSEITPYEVKTFPTGNEMMYVNESNISTFFTIVTKEEAQKLAAEQEGKFLYPLGPGNIGEIISNKGELTFHVSYSKNLKIYAPFSGTIDEDANGININSEIKNPDESYYNFYFGARRTNLKTSLETGAKIKAGQELSTFLGAEPIDINGKMSDADRSLVRISKYLDYNPPLKLPNGGTKTREVTRVTPPLSDKNMWVLKDGKPVIIRE